MTLASGDLLQERYRVGSLLGKGGMGAVFRGYDTRLDVSVAVKEMTVQPGLDEGMLHDLRGQFEQEAKTLARLRHANLVRVSDFFIEDPNAYLVMDFVEGESLADRIKRDGALPEAQVVAWMAELLDALDYCHGQGVLHRDVKPHNVIITSDGHAILVDFGLVKLWDPANPVTQTVVRGMGTLEYAPPEQYSLRSGHTDPRSDLYSLGSTMYHALTGQAPPTATDRMADPANFVPVRRLNPEVSANTEAVILKAMELARDARFPNARTMLEALNSPAQSGPEPAPVRMPEPTDVLPEASPEPSPQAQPQVSGHAVEPLPATIRAEAERRAPRARRLRCLSRRLPSTARARAARRWAPRERHWPFLPTLRGRPLPLLRRPAPAPRCRDPPDGVQPNGRGDGCGLLVP